MSIIWELIASAIVRIKFVDAKKMYSMYTL
jgi:hypothetical protein